MCQVCFFELRLYIDIDTYADYKVRQKLSIAFGLAPLVLSITVPEVITGGPV